MILHTFGERVEAVGPLRHKRFIVQLLADDDIQHRKRERVVGAGPDLQPKVSLLGERCAPRIDNDRLGIAVERLDHAETRFTVRPRQDRVVAPIEDTRRRHLAGVIADRKVAEGQDRRIHPRVETLGEARLAPVGCAERVAEARHPADVMTAGAGTERDGLGSILCTDREQTLRDFVERIVPGDAFPLAGLALALAPHRIFQPVRMVDKVGRHRPYWTQATMIERRLAIALDLQQHPIPHVQQYTASTVATAANALEDCGGLQAIVPRWRGKLSDVHANGSKSATTVGPVPNMTSARFGVRQVGAVP